MEFTASKTIAFKLNEKESKELTASLEALDIDHSKNSTREIILLLAQKAVDAVNQLTSENQEVRNELNTELEAQNQSLTTVNQELTQFNKDMQELNNSLTTDKTELKKQLSEVKSTDIKVKEIIKEVPIPIGQYQLLIDLNYFQLALLAKVANHFAVESLFNKQAQLNPAAFVRVEGKPKDRLSQTLINMFMGIQFNYHRGNTYLPENILTGDFIRKKGKEYQEQIAD